MIVLAINILGWVITKVLKINLLKINSYFHVPSTIFKGPLLTRHQQMLSKFKITHLLGIGCCLDLEDTSFNLNLKRDI